jgi:hypothetical protein
MALARSRAALKLFPVDFVLEDRTGCSFVPDWHGLPLLHLLA